MTLVSMESIKKKKLQKGGGGTSPPDPPSLDPLATGNITFSVIKFWRQLFLEHLWSLANWSQLIFSCWLPDSSFIHSGQICGIFLFNWVVILPVLVEHQLMLNSGNNSKRRNVYPSSSPVFWYKIVWSNFHEDNLSRDKQPISKLV